MKKVILNTLNPLSAKFIKWSNILKQFVGLSVFDHFVGLALKGLRLMSLVMRQKGEIQTGGKKKTKCVYRGITNVRFSEHLACFVFLLPPF